MIVIYTFHILDTWAFKDIDLDCDSVEGAFRCMMSGCLELVSEGIARPQHALGIGIVVADRCVLACISLEVQDPVAAEPSRDGARMTHGCDSCCADQSVAVRT